MSLLRSDEQVALNDLHMALVESAEHYRDAAASADDAALSDFLSDTAASRERDGHRVAALLRELDDLPKHPESDKQTIDTLLNHLGAAVMGDRDRALVQQRLEGDARLEDVIQAALAQDLPDHSLSIVEHIGENLRGQRTKLQQKLSSNP